MTMSFARSNGAENVGNLTEEGTSAEIVPFANERRRYSSPFRPVRLSDSGRYECQIGAESKMSHYLDLRVIGESLSRAAAAKFTPFPDPPFQVSLAKIYCARGFVTWFPGCKDMLIC